MATEVDRPWWQSLEVPILDPQSGLYRAEYLYERLSQELARTDDGSRFCLLLVDWAGSARPRPTRTGVDAIAHALFITARPFDVPARLAPRRFALLLPGVAGDLARRIGASMRLDLLVEADGGGDEWHVSCLECPRHRPLLEQLRFGDKTRRRRAA